MSSRVAQTSPSRRSHRHQKRTPALGTSCGQNSWVKMLPMTFLFRSEGNALSCLALPPRGGAQKEQNWEIRKNSSLGKAMLLPGQLNKQVSSAGSDFTKRMLKTDSKDNRINSIKRIIKPFKSTIQKNTESVRWHRILSAGNKDLCFPS